MAGRVGLLTRRWGAVGLLAVGLLAVGPGAMSRASPAASVQPPPVNAAADYQLGGASAVPPGVTVVTRDRTQRPAPGTYGICYVNAFQTQPGALRWWQQRHSDLLLRTPSGRVVRDPDWPDEVLLDTSTVPRRRSIARVVGGWMDGCARDGYRAVEPDNLDSWQRSRGRLSRDDNADLARRLVARAHAVGLAVAQKNTAELLRARSAIGFDFAVVEECSRYSECERFSAAYGDRVIAIEYDDAGGHAGFESACHARGERITIVYRDRGLVPAGRPGYVFATC